MTSTWRWLASSLAVLTGVMLAGGCGQAKPPGVGEDGTRGVAQAGGKCASEGATSECGIEISRRGDVIDCAKGTRVCRDDQWGACTVNASATSRFTVNAPPVSTSPQAGQLRALTISATATDCTDNPCNPYCKNFPDVPDAAITGDSAVTYPDRFLTFDDLPNGNPPDGFVKKGNDDDNVCGACYPGSPTPYAGAQACFEPCQFDSRCKGNGQNGCDMFAEGEKDACTGIDITSPLVCQIPEGAPNNVGRRKLAVCNRGSAPVPANSGIVCWKFPGGQPQYPESNPLASANNSAGPVDTFNEAIAPGECVTHIVDDDVFGNSGTTSVMCNIRQQYTSVIWVPSQGGLPTSANFPTSTVSAGTWATDTGAWDNGGGAATASFTGSSATHNTATATSVGAGWTNSGNVGTTSDASYATVAVAGNSTSSTLTMSSFGITGPAASDVIESISVDLGIGASASSTRAFVDATLRVGATTLATGAYNQLPTNSTSARTINFTNNGTVTSANLASLAVDFRGRSTQNNVAFTARVDSVKITINYANATTQTIELGGFGFSVPVGSTDVSLTAQTNWMSSLSSTQLCMQMFNASTSTAIGSAVCTTSGASPAALTTATTAGTAATVDDANNVKIRVWATRTAGAASSVATLDYAAVQLKYTTPPQLTGVDECNVHNNWTVSKKNPPLYCPAVTTYFDFTTSRVFDGVCPAGFRTRWSLFGWDSVTPYASKIDFRFRSFDPTVVNGVSTCVALTPVTSDPPSALSTAQSTPTDTQVCSLTSPPVTGCPADLATYLGGVPNSDRQCLQMDAYGTADSLNAAPTLNSWTVTYDCLPAE